MGLNADSYWKRQDRKTRDYLRHRYKVIIVVPTEQLYRKALKYLNNKVEIVRYRDFENFIVASLEKAPNKNAFPQSLFPENLSTWEPLNLAFLVC
jgi:hypothetical protein